MATGTGVAPFVSMARFGLEGFTILHGVASTAELYHEKTLRSAAKLYVPCVSGLSVRTGEPSGAYAGRVTDYLEREFPPGSYDFYLCGRREMIRDVTLIVDDSFAGSRVYVEVFF